MDAELGRFSPLSAPQREAVDAFCDETRPWALRQAKRTYRHLPVALREQAVDRTMQELRTRAPQSVDRQTLTAQLAELLTESLRHVHVGWCLNESSAQLRDGGLDNAGAEATRYDLGGFVEEGLGGLERAVLQLEIGAGRDSRTTRAALRLGPRQYARHREEGLSKLRDAISARVIGRACDQHVSAVVAAATGDRASIKALASGPGRCRYCAREAQGLRSVLHERLAVAPWPLAITPASLLVAKLGAVGAIFGGKAGGGTGFTAALGSSMGSGASTAASVLTVAALATGTIAVVDGGTSPRERAAGDDSAPPALSAPASAAGVLPGSTPSAPPDVFARLAAAARRREKQAAKRGGGQAGTPAIGGGSQGSTTVSDGSSTASGGTAPNSPTQVVDDATGQVRESVENVTSKLPPPVAKPIDDTLEAVDDTVGAVTDTVDGLLKPGKK